MQLSAYPFIEKLEPEALAFLQDHIQPVSIPKNTLLFIKVKSVRIFYGLHQVKYVSTHNQTA